jgi:hypothetical protein
MANSPATKFCAATRRMLADGSTNLNLSAAIDRGATASAQVENPRLYLPIRIDRYFLDCRGGRHARTSATDATHPRFNSRAQGRFRFDANREVLMKRDDGVASIHERRRCSANAKSRSSQPLAAYSRSNRNVARLAPCWSLYPAPLAFCSSSVDLPVRFSNNSRRSTPRWSRPSRAAHSC